jgi:hypothetical protein
MRSLIEEYIGAAAPRKSTTTTAEARKEPVLARLTSRLSLRCIRLRPTSDRSGCFHQRRLHRPPGPQQWPRHLPRLLPMQSQMKRRPGSGGPASPPRTAVTLSACGCHRRKPTRSITSNCWYVPGSTSPTASGPSSPWRRMQPASALSRRRWQVGTAAPPRQPRDYQVHRSVRGLEGLRDGGGVRSKCSRPIRVAGRAAFKQHRR